MSKISIWPDFIKKENIRDKNKRRPGEEGYDPSTLYIPSKEKKKLSGFLSQYWGIKKDHFDSVVWFGTCQWYFVLYHDADIVNKLAQTKLKICFGSTGFNIKDREFYFDLLTKNGYESSNTNSIIGIK